MIKLFNNNYGLTKLLVRWVIHYWYPDVRNPVSAEFFAYRFMKLMCKWSSNEGPVTTIKRLKVLRLLVTRYLTGEPLMVLPGSGIGVDKTGFPKCISYLKEYADSSSTDDKRYLLTLMGISRSFKVAGKVDLSSITDPFKGQNETLDNDKLSRIIKDFRLLITDDSGNPGLDRDSFSPYGMFRITTKAGPAGHALSTSM